MSRDISKSIKSKVSPLNCPYSMEQELYTIQLTRRELGLIKHYSRLLFANIDDDVSLDGGSRTGSHPIEKDWYGKDAITNLYKKSKTIVDANFNDDEELQLDKSLRYSTNMKSTWPWLNK